jgi:hypothetical protein
MSEMTAMSTRGKVLMAVGTIVRDQSTVEYSKVSEVSITHDDDGVERRRTVIDSTHR